MWSSSKEGVSVLQCRANGPPATRCASQVGVVVYAPRALMPERQRSHPMTGASGMVSDDVPPQRSKVTDRLMCD